MKHLILFALAAVSTSAFASFVEEFDDITTLPGSGWVQSNQSNPIGTTNWFQGNLSVFAQNSGTGYIGANFNNAATATSGTSTISNWLVTPTVTLANGATFSFWSRTVSSVAFPDRLQVRMSTNGTSSNTGTTATSVGDFSTLLLDINPTYTLTGYPNAWTQYTVNITGMNTPTQGRLAFRYFVDDAGPVGNNSDYIGIDRAEYADAIPEPATMAVLGLVAAAAARRKRK